MGNQDYEDLLTNHFIHDPARRHWKLAERVDANVNEQWWYAASLRELLERIDDLVKASHPLVCRVLAALSGHERAYGVQVAERSLGDLNVEFGH